MIFFSGGVARAEIQDASSKVTHITVSAENGTVSSGYCVRAAAICKSIRLNWFNKQNHHINYKISGITVMFSLINSYSFTQQKKDRIKKKRKEKKEMFSSKK